MNEQQKISLKRRFYLWLGAHVGGLFIRLLKITVNLKTIGEEHREKLMADGGRYIMVFWHGNMMIPMIRHINEGIIALVSQHGDGEILAHILKNIGCGLVRGSTTRGGARAIVEMSRLFQSQAQIAITPDGPKGPYREMKIGAVALAHRTGVPILPVSVCTSRPKFLRSWDKFLFVKPFVRCVMIYGEPIRIDQEFTNDELDDKQLFVEQELYRLDAAAESFFTTRNNEENDVTKDTHLRK